MRDKALDAARQRARRASFTEWLAVKAKHGNKCAQCGARGCLTKDHIIPYAKGGTNFAYNLQPLCGSCNSAKNARLEAGAQHSLFDRV